MKNQTTPIRYFWDNVLVGTPGDCWEWQAKKNAQGYGIFHMQGKAFRTHRFSYELHYGPIPKRMCICHTCDNPSCVNPAHLWLGTIADNNADKLRKGRARTHRMGRPAVPKSNRRLPIRGLYHPAGRAV